MRQSRPPVAVWFVFLCCLVCCLSLAPSAFAQGTSGRLVGTITEGGGSGAVVPGATVTAVNLETGWRQDTVSNDKGDYLIPNVPIGRYEVAAELTGFKRVAQSPVQLDVDQV